MRALRAIPLLRWLLASALGAALAGCTSDRVEVTTYRDEGDVCLMSRLADGSADAGLTVVAVVVFDACESYCAEINGATCDIVVEGDRIVLSSRAGVRRTITSDSACPDECLEVKAFCSSELPGAGTYTLEHGSRRSTVELPGSDACD
jgi:hypothetical protein